MSALDAPTMERPLGAEAAPLRPAKRAWMSRDAWSYLFTYYRPQWRSLALLALVATGQALALVPPLYFVRTAFDRAIPHGDVRLLLALGAGVVLARVLTAALALGARALGARVAKTATARMRLDLLARLYALSPEYHGASEAGRIHARVTQFGERVDQSTSTALSDSGPALLVMAAMLIWMTHIDAWLVLLAAPIAPLGWLTAAFVRRRVRRHVRIAQEVYERFNKGVLFVLGHIDLTRTRAFEAGELERQGRTLDELSRASRRMVLSYALYGQAQSVVAGVGAVVILVGGGVAIVQGALTTGSLFAFFAAAGIFNTYLSKVISLAPELIAAEEALDRMRELSLAGPLLAYPPGGATVAFTGRVRIHNARVGFRGRRVLDGISLEIAPGDRIAIIGANGAGKTTLLNLLLGFLKPEEGAVFAEDTTYEAADLGALRREIGVVPQKPGFFSGSIAENIAYGWPDVGAQAIAEAAAAAGARDFIEALPAGYETQIGEGGVLLSGGEAQRLAIARALVGRPKLLILDEPTNHLDAEAVASIMGRLSDGAARMAVLTVSHDPEVVRCARTVYRLERGSLARVRGRKAS